MNDLVERVASMSGVERRVYWNTEIKRLSPIVAEAQARAQRNYEARKTMAEIDLTAACGPARAAKEFERDADLAAFEAAHQQALQRRRALWDAHIRGTFGEAYARFDGALATAEALRSTEMEEAERPRRDFEAAFTRGKELAEWRGSAKGQKFAAAQAEQARQEEVYFAAAVQRGFPCSHWARWWAYDGSGNADFTWYEQTAPWRERWIAEHPEHREMLDSHNPDAWDAAEAAFGGYQVSPRADRSRWPA